MMKKMKSQFLCSSMMLPEHIGALKSHARKEFIKENYKFPQFDEQQLQEFDCLLKKSLQQGTILQVTCLSSTGFKATKGIVRKAAGEKLILETDYGLEAVLLKEVVEVKDG